MIDLAGRILSGFCGVGLLFIGARFLWGSGTDLILWAMVVLLWVTGTILIVLARRGDQGERRWR